MAATSPTPEPVDPNDPRPLSEHEQRAFSDLEQRTTHEDPAMAMRMQTPPTWTGTFSPRVFNGMIQAAVVFVVAVVLLPAPWAAALIAAALMVVPTALIVFFHLRDATGDEPRDPQ